MYTVEQKKVLAYLTAVMEGEIKDQEIVITKEDDGSTHARHMEHRAAVKDRNVSAKMLAEVYGLLESGTQVNVNSGDTQKLFDSLVAARKAVEDARPDKPE